MSSCNYENEVNRVRALGNDVRRSADASTLELLRAIDSTVDALTFLQKAYGEFEKITRDAAVSIRKCEPKKPIDIDNTICDMLSAAEGALQVQHAVMHKQLESAQHDRQLRGENKESVVSEYKRAITACTDLHNALVELRWAIMEHDADLSPVSKSYSDVNDLIKDLRT